jgi:type I restriction enzyme, S subunit
MGDPMSKVTTTLREMCEFVVDCPHFTPEWTTNGFLVIRNQNIRDGQLDLTQPSYTHKDDFDRRNRRAKPQAGDIIFTREAPMGEVCVVPEGLDCCLGQRQVLLRPRRDIDGNFLFYALRSAFVRHQIFWNEGTGSTVSNVRIPVLEALKVPRLGRAEDRVGALLGTLDEKIQLNRRMNETLETTARAIFNDWFVDFGPTPAKSDGRAPYLSPDLWSLFPDRLNSEGKPEGWDTEQLGDIFDVGIGRTPPRNESVHFVPVGLGYTWLSIKNMGGLNVWACRSDENLAKDTVDRLHIPVVPENTVIVSFKLTVGRVAITSHPMCTNEAIAHLVRRKSSCFGPFYMYLYMVQYDYGQLGSTSSIATAVNSKSIKSIKFINPGEACVHALETTVSPIFEKIRSNLSEIDTLITIRDFLLSKLMSGEVIASETLTNFGVKL